ncbi:DUF5675 family protein, partial [Limnobacter sp.]|uniref:DUF5675 family protein n=1 Tax=Limnobacter sp. TaxID=2003368 RepID=UPI002735CF96
MKLTLQRYEAQPNRTFGRMLAEDGHRLCYVLEDAVREIEGRPVAEWKIHGKTAIPAGDYQITLENSPRFGPDALTVNGVPGFVGVRMHAGNTEADTEGCPLLGMEVTPTGIMGGTSRPAVSLIKVL